MGWSDRLPASRSRRSSVAASGVSPARVALVVGQLTTGGAEGQLRQVTRTIDRRRFEPIVYALSAKIEPVGELLRADGVTLRVTEVAGWRRVPWLASQLAADKIDLVHSWLYIANALAWSATRFRRRLPLITSARNCKVQNRISQIANFLAFRGSRAIVANSQEVAAYITRHYLAPARRIHVVYNGIDVERFRPADRGAPTAPALIVNIGRLVEQKNQALFLDAAAQLTRTGVSARFVIVGEGPLKTDLQEQAQRLGIADHVSFAGERRDVEDILRTASLLWLTSRWEGLPNVVLEAMATGVPVIATDVGGTRELIRSGVDGFVVPSSDAAGFVRHARDLLNDSARQRQFAAAARVRAQEFSTARMIATLSQLYDDALGRREA
jgi:glycosyltransferase involved in cell wall biosynthesis